MNKLEQSLHQFQALPTPQSFRLIDFDSAEIHTDKVAGTFILIVRGTKPYLNMEVNLMPLVYVQQPEYWGIEVIGSLPGIGLPAEAPYTVSIPLEGIQGSKGIEVIGANQSKQLPIHAHINIKLLSQHWLNSSEEETENIKIYRPKNSREFPPSRFRMQYIFSEDGTCKWYYLAPNDGHHFRDGTWKIDANAENVIHIEQDGKVSYRILELTEELLRMVPI
jgi:hypothetical protein